MLLCSVSARSSEMKGCQYSILSEGFHNTAFCFFLDSRPLKNGKTASRNACGWSILTACPAAGMTTNLAAANFCRHVFRGSQEGLVIGTDDHERRDPGTRQGLDDAGVAMGHARAFGAGRLQYCETFAFEAVVDFSRVRVPSLAGAGFLAAQARVDDQQGRDAGDEKTAICSRRARGRRRWRCCRGRRKLGREERSCRLL